MYSPGLGVHFGDDAVGAIGPVERRQALAGLLVEAGQALGHVPAVADERTAYAVAVGVGVADGERGEAHGLVRLVPQVDLLTVVLEVLGLGPQHLCGV